VGKRKEEVSLYIYMSELGDDWMTRLDQIGLKSDIICIGFDMTSDVLHCADASQESHVASYMMMTRMIVLV
jgi:hypothetical protein